MNQDKIGKLIKELRLNSNLTQQQFAKKYNVTYQAVSNWENGKSIPDVAILKQISQDYNLKLDAVLEGNLITNQPNKFHHQKLIIFIIIILMILGISLVILVNHNHNFEFKTISSSCGDFNITGSTAYNDSKTSIYITNINYCGGDDKNNYSKIECILYSSNNNTETIISQYNYQESETTTLEQFLKKVEFKIDDFSNTCKVYKDGTLFLRINATDKNNKTITYKIPLTLSSNCSD